MDNGLFFYAHGWINGITDFISSESELMDKFVDMLNCQTENQRLIKEIFDEIKIDYCCGEWFYNIETKQAERIESDSDSESSIIVCEICKGTSFDNEHIIGCCNKGNCKIENMCSDCAIWDEDIDEYICGNC